jgi:primary-amine oxidase
MDMLNVTRYQWMDGRPQNTMKIQRSYIANEDQGKINFSPNAATVYAVVNKDTPTPLGEYPGYRIAPGT